jgi:hypothetical protein
MGLPEVSKVSTANDTTAVDRKSYQANIDDVKKPLFSRNKPETKEGEGATNWLSFVQEQYGNVAPEVMGELVRKVKEFNDISVLSSAFPNDTSILNLPQEIKLSNGETVKLVTKGNKGTPNWLTLIQEKYGNIADNKTMIDLVHRVKELNGIDIKSAGFPNDTSTLNFPQEITLSNGETVKLLNANKN